MNQVTLGPSYRIESAPPHGSRTTLALRLLAFAWLTGMVATTLAVIGLYIEYAPTLPIFTSMTDYQPKLGSRIYASDNQLIGEFAAERRVMVPPDKIPPLLVQAFVAAEDKRFFSHGGVDLWGVGMAVLDKIWHPSDKLRGASTITQQVAKSLLVSQESYETATARTMGRKVREALLARRLEQVLTKDQILYMYVHQIFLGHKAYGVQAAAEDYFKKNVWELSLAEIATLAGLPQRPSDYSPLTRPEAALMRRRYVLRRMFEDGYITDAQRLAAGDEKLTVFPRNELYLEIAPYYTEQVRREVVERYGENALLEEGLEVFTALNIEYQHIADAAIAQALRDLDKRQGYRGSLAQLSTTAERSLFLEQYRNQLNLAPHEELVPQKGVHYLGLVTAAAKGALVAEVNVAGLKGFLPLAGMRWARAPDPTVRVDTALLASVDQALKSGDVIMLQLTEAATLEADPYGKEVARGLPTQGYLFRLEQEPIAQGSLMAVDPRSGYVLAQIGGYDFEQSSFNRAVQACREPGSAFKPIVYSAAIDKLDYNASTLIDDKPLVFDDPDNAVRWKPANAGQTFRGQLPLRTCLIDSINTPAIRIAEAVGIEDIIANARRLGITTELKRELGTAIGSSCTTLMDLMQVYVTLNQYGQRRPLHFIRRVVDRMGNVLEERTPPWDPTLDLGTRLDRAYLRLVTPPDEVLEPQTSFLMTSLLQDAVREGTAVGASRTGFAVAGKTGTTNDSFDAWFMGFTKNLVTGVWIGHDQKERPLGVAEQGGRTALPAWVYFTTRALVDHTQSPPGPKEQGSFEPPPGIVQVAIDPETGLLARPEAHRTVLEYYRSGTEPTEVTPDKSVLNPNELDVFGADAPL